MKRTKICSITNDGCTRIYQILTQSRENCKRTVYDVCSYANFNTRSTYYNVVYGKTTNPSIIVRIGIGANVPVTMFPEYLEAANIILSPKFSVENKLFWEYLEKHSTDSYTNYDIDDLNEYLADCQCA